MKQARKATPLSPEDEILRLMLATPPQPHMQKVKKKKAKKRPKQ